MHHFLLFSFSYKQTPHLKELSQKKAKAESPQYTHHHYHREHQTASTFFDLFCVRLFRSSSSSTVPCSSSACLQSDSMDGKASPVAFSQKEEEASPMKSSRASPSQVSLRHAICSSGSTCSSPLQMREQTVALGACLSTIAAESTSASPNFPSIRRRRRATSENGFSEPSG